MPVTGRRGIRQRGGSRGRETQSKLTPPFIGGMVTDRSAYELDPNESPFLQDVIWPKGLPCLRGNWGVVGDTNPFGSAIAPAGVMAVQFPLTPTVLDFLITSTGGKVTRATSGAAATASIPLASGYTTLLPRCVYQGEVILCDQAGRYPILRNAGSFSSAGTVLSGSATLTLDSTVVTGTGTSFTTALEVGMFLAFGITADGITFISRVAKIVSNTELSLADPAPLSMAAANIYPRATGFIGLGVVTQDSGSVDVTTGGAVTGHGTGFSTPPANADAPLSPSSNEGPDYIWYATMPQTSAAYTKAPIATITNDTSIALSATTGVTAATAARYFTYRNLVGRDACVHQQSLFVAGCKWFRRRVFMLPPGAPLAGIHNLVDTLWSGPDFLAKWMDVPGPNTPGEVKAVLSGGSPGPLLVIATEGTYAVQTIYPPSPSNTQITLIGPGAGCVDVRSAISTEYGQFWCGPNGIYAFQHGKLKNLTEGRRGREWRSLMKNRSSTATVWSGVVNGHAFFGMKDASGPTTLVTWCYDLNREVWCGNITGLDVFSAHSASPVGFPEELYTAANITSGARIGAIGSVALDEGAAAGTNQGTFIADTPSNLGGDPTLLKRIIDAKIGYELVGGSAPTITFRSSDGFAAVGTDKSLAAGSAGQYLVDRVRPNSDVTASPAGYVGRNVRQFKIRLEATNGPSTLRVHELLVTGRAGGDRS